MTYLGEQDEEIIQASVPQQNPPCVETSADHRQAEQPQARREPYRQLRSRLSIEGVVWNRGGHRMVRASQSTGLGFYLSLSRDPRAWTSDLDVHTLGASCGEPGV